MPMEEQFARLDFSGKGFLTYQEYVGLCIALKKKPLRRKEMGNMIEKAGLRFAEDVHMSDEIRSFIGSGSELSYESVRRTCREMGLHFSDAEVAQACAFYGLEAKDTGPHKKNL